MSVPAEKLDILLKELLEQASKSSEDMKVIDLEEYKKQNKSKIEILNDLKKFVYNFNKERETFIRILANYETIYFLNVYIKLQFNNLENNKQLGSYKITLDDVEIDSVIQVENVLNEVKKYPNKKLKTTSLKIDEETYKVFKYLKKRVTEIQKEVEKYDFAPPPYMESALENFEKLINKIIEYKDVPEAILDLFAYFYADPDDLEWTDEDREYVRKHYASKEKLLSF